MIEGYCRRQSYMEGERVELCVSTDAPSFTIQVMRDGAAQGICYEQADISGAAHATPDDVVANGCRWPVAVRFDIAENWRSGFYRIELTSSTGEIGDAFFVVRTAQPKSKILWVIETNTWNAYNVFGGASTYTQEEGTPTGATYAAGVPRVSFQRPLARGFINLPEDHERLATVQTVDTSVPYLAWAIDNGFSIWSGPASWGQWGRSFAQWLEAEGIEVDYAINTDLHHNPDLLSGYNLMLSVGHDEYWSWEMRDAVEAFIASGGNAAFLSGNTAFWQVRLEQGGDQMVAYKGSVDEDPVMGTKDEHRNTGIWSHAKTGRPENQMTGLSFTRGGYARIAKATPASAGGYTVYRADHWALAGTGLRYGDQLGANHSLVGYECDGCELTLREGLPYATGEDGTPENFEVIGIAPVALWTHESALDGFYPEGVLSDLELVSLQVAGKRDEATLRRFAHGHAVMGSYSHPGGGTVFSGGTTEWAFALVDPQVAQITRNVIARLS